MRESVITKSSFKAVLAFIIIAALCVAAFSPLFAAKTAVAEAWPDTYAVTYEYNMGFTPVAGSYTVVYDGKKYDSNIPASLGAVESSEPGMRFAGFEIDGESVATFENDTFTVTSATFFGTAGGTVRLTPVFEAIQYTINYSLGENPPAGANNPNTVTTYDVLDNPIALLAPQADGKTGYWTLNGKPISVINKSIIASLPGNQIDLVAQWADEEYTLTVVLNEDEDPIVHTVTAGTLISACIGSFVPDAPAGLTFLGWAIDGEMIDINATVIAEDVTINAVFGKPSVRVSITLKIPQYSSSTDDTTMTTRIASVTTDEGTYDPEDLYNMYASRENLPGMELDTVVWSADDTGENATSKKGDSDPRNIAANKGIANSIECTFKLVNYTITVQYFYDFDGDKVADDLNGDGVADRVAPNKTVTQLYNSEYRIESPVVDGLFCQESLKSGNVTNNETITVFYNVAPEKQTAATAGINGTVINNLGGLIDASVTVKWDTSAADAHKAKAEEMDRNSYGVLSVQITPWENAVYGVRGTYDITVDLGEDMKDVENYMVYKINDDGTYSPVGDVIANGSTLRLTTNSSGNYLVTGTHVVNYTLIYVLIALLILLVILLIVLLLVILLLRKKTVEFVTNGGEEVEKVKAKNGSIVELPVPEREGFVFAGWYLDEECTQPAPLEPDPDKDETPAAPAEEDPEQAPAETPAEEVPAESAEAPAESAEAPEAAPEAPVEAPAKEGKMSKKKKKRRKGAAVIAEVVPAEELAAETPAEEVPAESVEAPAEETPAEETPAESVEAPAEETPAEEVPAESVEAPAEETPAEEVPAESVEAPAEETPAEEVPAENVEAPAEETPAETPAENAETPAEEVPAENVEVPAEETPAEEVPAESVEVPAEETPAETPAENAEAPAEEEIRIFDEPGGKDVTDEQQGGGTTDAMSSKRARKAKNKNKFAADPVEEAPVESVETPAEEVSAESVEAPVEETLVESAEAPVEEVSAENVETPTEEAADSAEVPAEEVPAESIEAPAEEVPAESMEAPAEEVPAESAEAPAEEAPAESAEAPAEEVPAESVETPAEEVSTENVETPVEESPAESAEAPAEEVSTENVETPVESVEAPAEEVPAESVETPAEEVPAEEVPAESIEAPAEEAPAESVETPAEETPVEVPAEDMAAVAVVEKGKKDKKQKKEKKEKKSKDKKDKKGKKGKEQEAPVSAEPVEDKPFELPEVMRYKVVGNVKLYAKWVEIVPEAAHAVNFIAFGVKQCSVATMGKEQISLPAAPAPQGYAFVRWYIIGKDGERREFTADHLAQKYLLDDLNVFADYVKVVPKVRFHACGVLQRSIAVQGICPIELPAAPELEEYRFCNWYVLKDGAQVPFTGRETAESYITSDIDVYAEYIKPVPVKEEIPPEPHTITFMADGEVVATVETAGRDALDLPAAPVKEGFVFRGWFTDEENHDTIVEESSFVDKDLEEDVTFYAFYEEEKEEEEEDVAAAILPEEDEEEVEEEPEEDDAPEVEEKEEDEEEEEESDPDAPKLITAADTIKRRTSTMRGRLRYGSDVNKAIYEELVNHLLQYKNVTRSLTNRADNFKSKGSLLAKITLTGKTLKLYLPLDAELYDYDKYHQLITEKNGYEEVPFTIKVKSNRGLKYAKELIDEAMAQKGVERKKKAGEKKSFKELILLQKGSLLIKAKKTDKLRSRVDSQDANAKLTDSEAQELVRIKYVPVSDEVKKTAFVGLDKIEELYNDCDMVNIKTLRKRGLVKEEHNRVKIIGGGTLTKSLKVYAEEYSLTAIKMIVLLGGKVVKLVEETVEKDAENK